jgi:steroid delta-isomerase-like uncharacterized protein
MGVREAAQRYFDAWNARDGGAVLDSLVPGGTYADPTTPGPLSGEALAAHVGGLWQAFPDLAFDLVSVSETGGGRIAAEWLMRGTNTGSFRGLPPTGKTVELPGADFIATDGDRITSVVGYFDAGAVPRQLGLQILVQPHSVGPFAFGNSVQVQSGRSHAPGAMAITTLHAVDAGGAEKVRDYSRQSLVEMLGMEGFVGATTGTIGGRMFTVSAWDTPEQPRQLMRGGTHKTAMQPFFAGEVATSGFTSVWVPARINPFWVRCDSCGRMSEGAEGKACGCGAALPAHPPYW